MELSLPSVGLEGYKSNCQRARIGTEAWGASHLFCPSCESPRLRQARPNTAAVDFTCPECDARFQLKSQSKAIRNKIVDAAFSEMRRAIIQDRTPNLFVLHYDLPTWAVRTALLIPHFAFALSAIERRKPLAPTARRAGWVGCNILLSAIPPAAQIPVVLDGVARTAFEVRRDYERVRPLETLKTETRGWTLDVLRVIQSLGRAEFDLCDAYAHSVALSRLHPRNRHVHEKIRQQLQVLRNMGILSFLGSGSYRLR